VARASCFGQQVLRQTQGLRESLGLAEARVAALTDQVQALEGDLRQSKADAVSGQDKVGRRTRAPACTCAVHGARTRVRYASDDGTRALM
jgi:hypothetical protein